MMKIYALLALLLVNYVAAEDALPSIVSIKVAKRTEVSAMIQWENPEEVTYSSFKVSVEPSGEVSQPEEAGETSRIINALSPGREYKVKIQGVTTSGSVGDEVVYAFNTVPKKPSNIKMEPIDEIEISITIMGKEMKFTATVSGMEIDWDGVDDPEGVTGYDVSLSPSGGISLSEPSDDAIPTKTIYTGLTPGQTYMVEVRTVTGPKYNPIRSEPVVYSVTVPPDIPLSAEVGDVTSTTAEIKTHLPVVGIADGLEFEMDPDKGKVGDPRPNRLYSMFDMYTLRDLRAGTRYTAKVYATSKDVRGKKFVTVDFTTVPNPPNVRVVDFSEEVVKFVWKHPHVFTDNDDVFYILEYRDLTTNEVKRATIENLDLSKDVEIDVEELIPGTKYTFQFTTVINTMKSITASEIITQATIPMPPNRKSFELLDFETYEAKFSPPDKGHCPQVKVFYSPSFNKDKPQLYNIDEAIILTGIPANKRYVIQARCVANTLESRELTFTVEDALFDLMGGVISFDDPNVEPITGRLPCFSVTRTEKKESLHKADACCGDFNPYSTAVLECCGNDGVLIAKTGNKLCCGNQRYSKTRQRCCPEQGNQVIEASMSCADLPEDSAIP